MTFYFTGEVIAIVYLHVLWLIQLETTLERIKAVDRAAAVVEEMLKQGTVNNGLKVRSIY